MSSIEQVFKNLEDANLKTLENLKKELNQVRAGKASASLLDSIRVNAYGSQSPLSQVSSVSVPDARTLVISPWDKSLLAEIEKAIVGSDLGLAPQNDGKIIRLSIPALTEERRKDLVKSIGKMSEESKVALRQHRKNANEEIKSLEKQKALSEDEAKKQLDAVQKSVDSSTKAVDEVVEKKSKEIMTI